MQFLAQDAVENNNKSKLKFGDVWSIDISNAYNAI